MLCGDVGGQCMSLKPTVPNLINRNKPVTEQVSEMVADSEDTSKNDNTMYKAAGFVLVQVPTLSLIDCAH